MPENANTNSETVKQQEIDANQDSSALRDATIQQGIEAEIDRYKSLGYSKEAIGGQLLEIEENVEARVALAETRDEGLGSWDSLVKADQREELRELEAERQEQDRLGDAEKAQDAPQAPEKAQGDPETQEKALEGQAQEKAQDNRKSTHSTQSVGDDGIIEPTEPNKERDTKFDTPSSYTDRFVVTKNKDKQEFYRSYDDQHPAIVDKGDQLSTKNADRGTAMDMIELADHRGWQSLRAKGPEDFRREMWIEGMAHGIKVDGYRASEKDIEEAKRRADLVQSRVIERTDDRETQGRGGTSEAGRAPDQLGDQSNVVKMPVLDFKNGVEGKITDIGSAPYRGREGADPVPYVKLETEQGSNKTLWSVTLPDAVEKNDLKVGDKATFYSPGTEPVVYTTTDKKTGEQIQREGERRIWDAKDIERGIEAPQKKDEPQLFENERKAETKPPAQEGSNMANKEREQNTASDRLEDRIKKYEPGDTQVKGAASTLTRMDAELRAAGVSEKERETARNEASKMLAHGVSRGQQYPVQKLPNVSKEQVAQAQEASKQANQANKTQERTTENAERSSRER